MVDMGAVTRQSDSGSAFTYQPRDSASEKKVNRVNYTTLPRSIGTPYDNILAIQRKI